MDHEVLHYAWVELKIADQTIARSKVGWSAAHTIWIDAISIEQMLMHMRTLKVVSLTRHLKLHLLLTVAIGAAKMSQLMVTPGGAVPWASCPAQSSSFGHGEWKSTYNRRKNRDGALPLPAQLQARREMPLHRHDQNGLIHSPWRILVLDIPAAQPI